MCCILTIFGSIPRQIEPDNHFPGLVDDVRIYDIALSSDEIAWLAGASGHLCTSRSDIRLRL